MDIESKLEQIRERFDEIQQAMADPSIYDRPSEYRELTIEHTRLKELVEDFDRWKELRGHLQGNRELLDTGGDPELMELAREESREMETQIKELEEEIRFKLIPKDPEDSRDCIVEIRSGTGGDEAALFAGDLFEMYRRYAESKRWKMEMLSVHQGEMGGYRDVVFGLKGEGVFGEMKYESGVHRVQRVPETESQGRVHTSAATVAVLPEAEEVDVELNMGDVRIDTFRSSGAGGQHVNKTDSAIRLTHAPTGIVVECQEERSQHKNKDRAISMLRSRLYDRQLEAQRAERAAERKSQVSTGDRSAKIRTYNFPQGRVTDHRINLTLYNLDAVMKGDIGEVIQALKVQDNLERLQAVMEES